MCWQFSASFVLYPPNFISSHSSPAPRERIYRGLSPRACLDPTLDKTTITLPLNPVCSGRSSSNLLLVLFEAGETGVKAIKLDVEGLKSFWAVHTTQFDAWSIFPFGTTKFRIWERSKMKYDKTSVRILLPIETRKWGDAAMLKRGKFLIRGMRSYLAMIYQVRHKM